MSRFTREQKRQMALDMASNYQRMAAMLHKRADEFMASGDLESASDYQHWRAHYAREARSWMGVDAMGCVGGCSSRLIRIDGEFDPQEAILAYLTTSDTEREPVAWQKRCLFPDKHTGEKPQWQDCLAMEVKSWPQHDYQYRPLYAAPLPLTDLEAENARLKAELAAVKEMYAREGAKALYELERAERAEARLAEALKALEQIEQQLDYGQNSMALHITRSALEGSK